MAMATSAWPISGRRANVGTIIEIMPTAGMNMM